ncbi:MAG: DeoR/GlpR family DNA-binding transcription regulator [Pseudomonadota bacterium]
MEKLPPQRHALILDMVRAHGAASIHSLAEHLNVSPSTVRRDLEYLTEGGYLERTHGGAVSRRPPTARFEVDASIAAETARAEKRAIGAEAARRVMAGQSVIFDASSTVRAAAEHVIGLGVALTAVTNDLVTARILVGSSAVETVVAGGTVLAGTTTLVGEPAHGFLSRIHADIAFIGVHTISGNVLTETSLEVARMKQLMIAAANKVIVLADSTKFTSPAFVEICRINEVSEIITDAGASPQRLNELRSAGVECTVAP